MKTRPICLALALLLLCPTAPAQWVRTSDPCPDSLTGGVACLAVSGTNLFVGTGGSSGVFRSTDYGTSWTAVNRGLRWRHVDGSYYGADRSFAVIGTTLFAGGLDGVYLSTNDGTIWTAANQGLPENLYDTAAAAPVICLAVSGTNLFAGTEDYGVFLSTNNGTSWTAVNEGLPASTYAPLMFASIQCLAVSGMNLFAGTAYRGIYRSTNSGASWTAVSEGLHTDPHDNTIYMPVQCLVTSGTNLFAGASWGTGSGGVFCSANNGTNWTCVSYAFPYTPINALAVTGTNLLAGCGGGQVGMHRVGGPGVFLSTNNGTSWTAVNEGLPGFSSEDTAHYPGIAGLVVSGAYLFATTELERGFYGWGIFRRPLTDMITSAQSSSSPLPVAFTLYQNYPNPFNPSTSIKYTIGGVSPVSANGGDRDSRSALQADRRGQGLGARDVSLIVYDVLGRQVEVLVNEKRAAGYYQDTFDGSGLASGVYICRLTAGLFVQSRTMLLIK
jgi:hypothetical protein